MNNLTADAIKAISEARDFVFRHGGSENEKSLVLWDSLDGLLPKTEDKNPRYPGVGVGVVVVRPHNTTPKRSGFDILLMKRKNAQGWGDGEWSLPGGKIDFYESPEDTARRETLEETGLFISGVLTPLGYTNDVWKQHEKHYITLYYAAWASSDKAVVREPTKCYDMQWVNVYHLADKSIQLFTGIREILSKNTTELQKRFGYDMSDEFN